MTNTQYAPHNVDYNEIAKFTALAEQWWDTTGPFKPLHDINPLRRDWIDEACYQVWGSPLAGKQVLDVGCGGGILAHALADKGATVLGVDLGEANLRAGEIYAQKTGMDTLSFRHIAVEQLASEQAGMYDVVTCMEMLEHVPNPQSVICACHQLLKPGGVCVLSTINRNPKAYLFAIIGAEYLLRLLDKGTHEYDKFITPAELDKMAMNAGFDRHDMIGLHYNPLTKRYWLAANVDVNYMMAVKKPVI